MARWSDFSGLTSNSTSWTPPSRKSWRAKGAANPERSRASSITGAAKQPAAPTDGRAAGEIAGRYEGVITPIQQLPWDLATVKGLGAQAGVPAATAGWGAVKVKGDRQKVLDRWAGLKGVSMCFFVRRLMGDATRAFASVPIRRRARIRDLTRKNWSTSSRASGCSLGPFPLPASVAPPDGWGRHSFPKLPRRGRGRARVLSASRDPQ